MFRQVVIDIAYPSNSQAPNHFLITSVVSTDGWWYGDDPTLKGIHALMPSSGVETAVSQAKAAAPAVSPEHVAFVTLPNERPFVVYRNSSARALINVRVRGDAVVQIGTQQWTVPIDLHWPTVPVENNPNSIACEPRYLALPKGMPGSVNSGERWNVRMNVNVTEGDILDRLGL